MLLQTSQGMNINRRLFPRGRCQIGLNYSHNMKKINIIPLIAINKNSRLKGTEKCYSTRNYLFNQNCTKQRIRLKYITLNIKMKKCIEKPCYI